MPYRGISMKQVRVLNHKNCATRDCAIGDIYDVLHFAKAGTVDYLGLYAEHDSVAFIDAVGDVAIGWTSGPMVDLEFVA